jgi:glycosyltransferase involved in cell wall biosynthesis
MNLCMIEPRLISYSGHLYNYASSVKKEVENNGGQFKILVSKDCDKNILMDLNGEQVFDRNPSDKYFHNVFSKFLFATFIYNLHLYKGLKKSDKKLTGDWTYLMGTTQYIDLFAIFFFNLLKKKSNKFILTLRLTIYRYDLKRWSINVFWYWIGLQLLFLQNTVKKNIKLITDSEALKFEFERITLFKVYVFPIPHTNTHNDYLDKPSSNNNLIATTLGPARIQKGFHQITNLIKLYLDNTNDFKYRVTFHLHCVNSDNNSLINDDIIFLKNLNSDHIKIIEHNLTEIEYFRMLNDSDIVLLPYDSLSYFAQTSGIFTESLSMGKCVIVSKNTWMSAQLKNYNCGVEIIENNNQDFYEKFKYLVNNISDFKSLSKKSMYDWNLYHNSNRFVKELHNL